MDKLTEDESKTLRKVGLSIHNAIRDSIRLPINSNTNLLKTVLNNAAFIVDEIFRLDDIIVCQEKELKEVNNHFKKKEN